MNDTIVSSTQGGKLTRRWLLFIHQLPPKPDYFRVKVRRRLQRIGAVPLKNSVYVLPDRAECREDFEWLLREVLADGGEATICGAAMLGGTTDAELESAFRRERDAEYAQIETEARSGGPHDRLRRKLEGIMRNDFFGASGKAAAERAVSGSGERGELGGSTWVTRSGVFVDRIASAWLIRRFIDPAARFRFVAEHDVVHAGELRFDMFGGEYTHEGERCTFETLLHRFALVDAALVAIGEIVHDIDLKEERYRRPETSGIESVLKGITLDTSDDGERLERGASLFEGLYARLRSESATSAEASASSTTPSAT
jgi:hypothetical protein